MNETAVTLDVREEIRQGREPFSQIMRAVAGLQPGETLRLLAPFKPEPLFDVMTRRGFTHVETALSSGDWEVVFSRDGQKERSANPDSGPPAQNHINRIEVDARGQEPPQPLVTILEALNTLPPEAELLARTDRRPMHLYAQLEDRGYRGESEEQNDGSFITHIRRL